MKYQIKIALTLLVVVAGVAYLFYGQDIPLKTLVKKYGQPPSKFIELASGAKVHYRDQGNQNGKPLLLLHGSHATLFMWEPWVEILGDEFRLISVDLPAHGLTGAIPNGTYTEEQMTSFVDEFSTAIGIDKFSVIGSSMGGKIAAYFSLLHPERVEKLVLINASGIPTKLPSYSGIFFRILNTPILNNIALYMSPRLLIQSASQFIVVVPSFYTHENITRYEEINRVAGSRAARLKMVQTPFDPFIKENVSKITPQTLIVWGAKDKIVPIDVGESYHEAIKGSEMIVYNNVGHIPVIEIPERSAEDVRSFLEGGEEKYTDRESWF